MTSIDFAKAMVDYNEQKSIKGFNLRFSTALNNVAGNECVIVDEKSRTIMFPESRVYQVYFTMFSLEIATRQAILFARWKYRTQLDMQYYQLIKKYQ